MQNQRNILSEKRPLGRFHMHHFKQVDKPTSLITNDVKRIDYRDNPLARASRGEYGQAAQREVARISVKYPLSNAQLDTALHLGLIKDNPVNSAQAPIPTDPYVLTRHIKRLGYYLKADIVGICRISEYAVYSHDFKGDPINIDYKFAIVLVMGKEYETVEASTGYDWIADAISFRCYQHLALVSHTIASYIRTLGFRASAQHPPSRAGRYQVVIPPLLLWSGIGEICRIGIVLNPYLGASFKAAAVLTDLPLVPDKPIDFKLQDFCQRCKKCAVECPSQAIPMGDKTMYNGYETWKLDERRCASFNILNAKGAFCTRCSKVCPWTRPTTMPHNFVRWLARHSSIVRKSVIRIEDILGHKNAKVRNKWWFDLEDVDGIVGIPRSS